MSFSDYIALVKKKSETADTSSFNTDNILSYIVLSGCNDQEILEEVLKLSKNPDFEQIVRIGTNLEVSRSILQALPGSKTPIQNRSYKTTGRNKKHVQCTRCGSYKHTYDSCRLPLQTQCYNCRKKGHLSMVCQEDGSEKSESASESSNNDKQNAEREVDPE